MLNRSIIFYYIRYHSIKVSSVSGVWWRLFKWSGASRLFCWCSLLLWLGKQGGQAESTSLFAWWYSIRLDPGKPASHRYCCSAGPYFTVYCMLLPLPPTFFSSFITIEHFINYIFFKYIIVKIPLSCSTFAI